MQIPIFSGNGKDVREGESQEFSATASTGAAASAAAPWPASFASERARAL
jgi:hypothetical protein